MLAPQRKERHMASWPIPLALAASVIVGATAVSLMAGRCALVEFAGMCPF